MFISRKEKDELWSIVQGLQGRVRDLEIEAIWLKNKTTKTRPAIVKSEGAPWGIKKDGTPRKRPGRPKQFMGVGL
jgi:hypothetical protein